MTLTSLPADPAERTQVRGRSSGRGFLAGLEDQRPFAFIGPNWFAAVMGTGRVAAALATMPVHVPGLRVLAEVVWLLDVVVLAAVLVATAMHWALHPRTARGHLADPVMSHFYGAPAMALMTVGAGALLVGAPVVGPTIAIGMAAVLWLAGTLMGLWTAVAVPVRAFTTHEVAPNAAFGGWLMPVVPPMVSAATGPLLLAHLPAGQWRLSLLLACVMMFGLTLVASLVVITLIWSRLVHHKVGAAAAVPTLWIVLGPLGQSVTASHTLGVAAPTVLPEPFGSAFEAMGLVFGLPMWGFAMLWLAIAASITIRTMRSTRSGLPFTLTWWSFTFPVGTVVTGTSGLAVTTGASFLSVAALVLYAGLLVAWGTVAFRTARGVWDGRLLRRPTLSAR